MTSFPAYIGKLFGIDQETSVRRPSIVVVGGCLGQQGKYSRPRERVAGGKAGKEVCPLAQIAQPHFLPDKTAAAEASGWALLRSLQLPALPDGVVLYRLPVLHRGERVPARR